MRHRFTFACLLSFWLCVRYLNEAWCFSFDDDFMKKIWKYWCNEVSRFRVEGPMCICMLLLRLLQVDVKVEMCVDDRRSDVVIITHKYCIYNLNVCIKNHDNPFCAKKKGKVYPLTCQRKHFWLLIPKKCEELPSKSPLQSNSMSFMSISTLAST